MRIAIPTFRDEVSPRFCFARQVLVVQLDGAAERARTTLDLSDLSYPERLHLLQSQGVTLLVCGGFDRAYLPAAERARIHLVWGVSGQLDDAIRRVAAGGLAAAGHHPECWCAARADARTKENRCRTRG